MFVSSGQFYIFMGSLAFGILGGVFHRLAASLRVFWKNRFFRAALDIAAFLLLAALYVAFAYYYNFPSVRAYMIAAVFLGMLLGEKSLAICCFVNRFLIVFMKNYNFF